MSGEIGTGRSQFAYDDRSTDGDDYTSFQIKYWSAYLGYSEKPSGTDNNVSGGLKFMNISADDDRTALTKKPAASYQQVYLFFSGTFL